MGGTISINYSCVASGNAVLYNLTLGFDGSDHNITGDPKFVNAGSGNFKLQSSSICKDSGDSTGAPTSDIEGTSRPQGAGYDMGAYE
jgi:hypothetical protein